MNLKQFYDNKAIDAYGKKITVVPPRKGRLQPAVAQAPDYAGFDTALAESEEARENAEYFRRHGRYRPGTTAPNPNSPFAR
jgi:hypothetical protein